MNIFLTGEIQVGKSTIIKKILKTHPDWSVGGFVTVTRFGDIPGAVGGVYIQKAPGSDEYSADNRVGIRWSDNRAEGFAEPFEKAAENLLAGNECCDIVLMDELGFMESGAQQFQAAVLRELESDVPVLGVIKPRHSKFLDAVRSAWDTQTVEITVENREEMFEYVNHILTEAAARRRV